MRFGAACLLGRSHVSIDAYICGYERRRMHGAEFPVVIPAEKSARVSGRLYLNVKPRALQRLDGFEGDFYVRRAVTAFLVDANGRSIPQPAYLYLLAPRHRHRASRLPWNPQQFAEKQLGAFKRKNKLA